MLVFKMGLRISHWGEKKAREIFFLLIQLHSFEKEN